MAKGNFNSDGAAELALSTRRVAGYALLVSTAVSVTEILKKVTHPHPCVTFLRFHAYRLDTA